MSRLPQSLKANLPVTVVVVIVIASAVGLLAEVNSAKGSNTAQLKMSSSGAPKSTLQVQAQSSSFTAGSGASGANNTSTGSPQSQPSTGQSGVQSTIPVQPVGKCTGCPTGSDPGDSATACPDATCTPPTLPQCPTCGGVRKTMTSDAIMCPMIMCAQ